MLCRGVAKVAFRSSEKACWDSWNQGGLLEELRARSAKAEEAEV
jgi:hypothetical protein